MVLAPISWLPRSDSACIPIRRGCHVRLSLSCLISKQSRSRSCHSSKGISLRPCPPYLNFFASIGARSASAITACRRLTFRYGSRSVRHLAATLLEVVQDHKGLPFRALGFSRYSVPPNRSFNIRGTVSTTCFRPMVSRKYIAVVPPDRWPIVFLEMVMNPSASRAPARYERSSLSMLQLYTVTGDI